MRIVTSAAAARPQPIDRNPVFRSNAFQNVGTAPHVTTTRWSYTVPAGKRALAMHILARMDRDAAAAPGAIAISQVLYTPNGGSQVPVCMSYLNQNAIGAGSPMNVGQSLLMAAGDTLIANSQDASTGGTTLPTLSWSGFEYDV